MSAKYHDLPDIDTAADVFETADEPEQILRPSENILGNDDEPVKALNENIDSSTLPGRRKAEKVFGRGTRKYHASYMAFRPRLPRPTRHASSSDSDTDADADTATDPTSRSLISSATRLHETPAARLKRLKLELEEVEQEIQAGPSTLSLPLDETRRRSVLPKKEPVDLMGQVAGLRDKLEGIKLDGGSVTLGTGPERISSWSDKLHKLSLVSSGQVDQGQEHRAGGGSMDDEGATPAPVDKAGEASGGPSTGQLSDIDSRLAQLEKLLGSEERTADSVQAPLVSSIGKLDHLLSLLTQPRHLDAISRRLKLLLVDLDRAVAASRRPGGTASGSAIVNQASGPAPAPAPVPGAGSEQSSGVALTLSEAEHASLQALFTLLPRLDPLIPIVPPLLVRLRSLALLHAEAGGIVDDLKRVRDEEKRGAEGFRELQEVVETVDRGLTQAVEGITRNWQGLEGRMSALEGRIKALGS